MTEALARLIEHLQWADLRTLEALRRASPAPAGALEIYAHVLGAEQVWLSRMKQEAPSLAVWPALSLEACARLSEDNARALESFVGSLTPRDLTREVSYTNSVGQAFRSTIEDILLHLAMHGAYHRGQVALLLRRHGAEPAITDYIAFVRGAPTAPRVDP